MKNKFEDISETADYINSLNDVLEITIQQGINHFSGRDNGLENFLESFVNGKNLKNRIVSYIYMDLDRYLKDMISEHNLDKRFKKIYISKIIEISKRLFKDRFLLITNFLISEKNSFLYKIEVSEKVDIESSRKASGNEMVFAISPAEDIYNRIDKKNIEDIKSSCWQELDDIANLRTENIFCNIIFMNVPKHNSKTIRLKLKSGEQK